MGAYDFDMWARAGRSIEAEYARYGSPTRALAGMAPPPRFLHLYSQPRAAPFLAAQEDLGRSSPWFSVRRLDAVSHFPTLEIPDAVVRAIDEFAG
jgi:hypothetical protein